MSSIGIACLLFAINIRTTDGVVFDITTLGETLSVLINYAKVAVCVEVVKFLNVLATCRKYGTR